MKLNSINNNLCAFSFDEHGMIREMNATIFEPDSSGFPEGLVTAG